MADKTRTPSEREIVLDILTEHERKGTFTNILIRRAQDRYAGLPLAQRSFIKRLAEGTVERQIELDDTIGRFLRDPSMKMKPIVRCMLRMSVYQIYYMDSVPDFAAVNEALRILKNNNQAASTGFVNAVLRNVCREKEARERKNRPAQESGEGGKTISIAIAGQDQDGGEAAAPRTKDAGNRVTTVEVAPGIRKVVKRPRVIVTGKNGQGADKSENGTSAEPAILNKKSLSLTYSMPREIVAMWEEDYGREKTETILKAMMEIRPVSIRLDPRYDEKTWNEILEQMRQGQARIENGRWLPYCRYLSHIPQVSSLPGFAEGIFTVQDESSMMAVQALGLTGKETLLDLCAAPGGKTMHAASLLPEGSVMAFDISRAKTDQIRENLTRMKLTNVTVGENDAGEYNPALENIADAMICDLPCSGLGIITRKRDIKYNVSQEKIRSLVALQKKILKNAVHYLKPGGVMVYSTCTIDRQENEKMADFIEKKLGMIPTDLAPFLPDGIPDIQKNRLQLLPGIHGTDGFFVARFMKPETKA